MTNKNQIRFFDLPKELQAHLIMKVGICILNYTTALVLYLFTGKSRECAFLALALSFYTFSVVALFRRVLSGNIYVYEGVCEKKCGQEYSLKLPLHKPFFTTWSFCYLVMKMQQGNELINMEVPCGYGFQVEKGNTIRVYAKEDKLIKKNKNTCSISNPILVSVIKT